MKKLALIMLAIVSMALVSCGGGEMTPQTTKISGPLGNKFEVVDKPVKLQGNVWSIEIKCIGGYDYLTPRLPFGIYLIDKSYVHVGFGLESFDKNGNIIDKRSATEVGSDDPYIVEDVKGLMNLKVGESGFIRWTCKDSEKNTKGMTFKITSAEEFVWK